MLKRLKDLAANPYLHSWLATALAFIAFDAQEILVKISNGDWSWPVIQLLVFVVLRSFVKALIVLLFPKLPIEKPTN